VVLQIGTSAQLSRGLGMRILEDFFQGTVKVPIESETGPQYKEGDAMDPSILKLLVSRAYIICCTKPGLNKACIYCKYVLYCKCLLTHVNLAFNVNICCKY
jgi:hypothetical protein